MNKQIPIEQLAVGMYLVGIDKSWLETPFLRHRFQIASQDQIAKLKACGVRAVHIDPLKGVAAPVQAEDAPFPGNAAHRAIPDARQVGTQAASDPSPATLTTLAVLSEQAPCEAPRAQPEPRHRVTDDGARRTFRTDHDPGLEEFTDLLRTKMILQLALPFQNKQTLCTTRLLGWSEGDFLLTELPYHEGRAIEFRPGILCVVRFVKSGRVFGFRTETIKGQFSPMPLLFLGFPTEIEELSLRRSPRVPVTLKATLWPGDHPDALIMGVIKDISLSGCGIEVTAPSPRLVPEASVTLDVNLPGIGLPTKLAGVVRNIVSKPTHGVTNPARIQVGIEFRFSPAEPQVAASVEQFVTEQLTLTRA